MQRLWHVSLSFDIEGEISPHRGVTSQASTIRSRSCQWDDQDLREQGFVRCHRDKADERIWSFVKFLWIDLQVRGRCEEEGVWELDEHPDTILHAMHVDDCGEAYVALAEADISVVKGQYYNISAREWETLWDVANAIANEYGIEGGVKYVDGPEGRLPADADFNRMLRMV